MAVVTVSRMVALLGLVKGVKMAVSKVGMKVECLAALLELALAGQKVDMMVEWMVGKTAE